MTFLNLPINDESFVSKGVISIFSRNTEASEEALRTSIGLKIPNLYYE